MAPFYVVVFFRCLGEYVTLVSCEAPEMFYGRRNFTQLAIGMGVGRY